MSRVTYEHVGVFCRECYLAGTDMRQAYLWYMRMVGEQEDFS